MSAFTIVCDDNPVLIRKLSGNALVIRTKKSDNLTNLIQFCRQVSVNLLCIWVDTDTTLSSITFQEAWKEIPIAFYVSGMGRFKAIVPLIPLLRQMNIRIYFPTNDKDNYASVRILASLGIQSALYLNGNADWEMLSDLASYALFGIVPHASIEPFQYIASHYRSDRLTDFGAVYFEDPLKFLYINENEQIGLSLKDMTEEKYLMQRVEDIRNIPHNPEYVKHCERWREFFLKPDGCAYCQGWRICLGKYSDYRQDSPGCESFFTELMDCVEQYQTIKKRNQKEIWQP